MPPVGRGAVSGAGSRAVVACLGGRDAMSAGGPVSKSAAQPCVLARNRTRNLRAARAPNTGRSAESDPVTGAWPVGGSFAVMCVGYRVCRSPGRRPQAATRPTTTPRPTGPPERRPDEWLALAPARWMVRRGACAQDACTSSQTDVRAPMRRRPRSADSGSLSSPRYPMPEERRLHCAVPPPARSAYASTVDEDAGAIDKPSGGRGDERDDDGDVGRRADASDRDAGRMRPTRRATARARCPAPRPRSARPRPTMPRRAQCRDGGDRSRQPSIRTHVRYRKGSTETAGAGWTPARLQTRHATRSPGMCRPRRSVISSVAPGVDRGPKRPRQSLSAVPLPACVAPAATRRSRR